MKRQARLEKRGYKDKQDPLYFGWWLRSKACGIGIWTGFYPLPLSFRSCVPFREIRLCDVDGVGDFFGVPGSPFGCGPAGCPLASGPVPGEGEDRGVQAPAEPPDALRYFFTWARASKLVLTDPARGLSARQPRGYRGPTATLALQR